MHTRVHIKSVSQQQKAADLTFRLRKNTTSTFFLFAVGVEGISSLGPYDVTSSAACPQVALSAYWDSQAGGQGINPQQKSFCSDRG